jgi:NhaP-type Na+/H+ and K+/H+ antiporter
MIETTVEPEMQLANRVLRDASIPADCLVVSIRRGSEQLFPRGRTLIKPGDVLTVLMSPRGEMHWNDYLHSYPGQAEEKSTPQKNVSEEEGQEISSFIETKNNL